MYSKVGTCIILTTLKSIHIFLEMSCNSFAFNSRLCNTPNFASRRETKRANFNYPKRPYRKPLILLDVPVKLRLGDIRGHAAETCRSNMKC